ncbi:hypothetical protein FZEAL_6188 [Fusarium zealandicum]|uniref:F-box domain-containing protein n=1 Tax=Fusarium zealandicum TaxID=1053134 RepID=A0A8H4UJG0_9HYPO|nr:hypothetical protein FZEAL_6188 [Fusarium zealandicum]
MIVLLWWKIVEIADSSVNFLTAPVGWVIPPSRIPQFIFDTDHSCLNEDQGLVEASDAYDATCKHQSRSRTSIDKIPDDLFQHLILDNEKNAIMLDSAFGWLYLHSRLREILNCKAALDNCESLRIKIRPYPGSTQRPLYSLFWEPNVPPSHVPGLLADVLTSMPNLKKLECVQLSNESWAIGVFEAEFQKRDLTLPSVKRLFLGPDMHFLIAMCPNLKSVDTSEGYPWYPRIPLEGRERHDLIRATKSAPKLEEFGMHLRWHPKDLEEIRENMPQLKTLRLHGKISRRNSPCYHCSRGAALTRKKIKNIAPALAKFTSLTTLHLPQKCLGTGLCRQSPDSPLLGPTSVRDIQIRRRVTRVAMWMIEEISEMILAQVPGLESLVIGNMGSSFVHRGRVFWPWTGQLREYIMEAWPRYKARRDLEPADVDEEPDSPLFGRHSAEDRWLSGSWRPVGFRRGVTWLTVYEFEDGFDEQEEIDFSQVDWLEIMDVGLDVDESEGLVEV